MGDAIDRFAKIAPLMTDVSKAVDAFAEAFTKLDDVPTASLKRAAEDGLQALPKVEQMAKGMSKVAPMLQKGVDDFVKPIDRLSTSLERLNAAVMAFQPAALALPQRAGVMAGNLARQAEALRAIEAAAIPQAVQGAEIFTVKVMHEAEGGPGDNEDVAIAKDQLAVLRELSADLRTLAVGGLGREVNSILELLEANLPEITQQEKGLVSELNRWNA